MKKYRVVAEHPHMSGQVDAVAAQQAWEWG